MEESLLKPLPWVPRDDPAENYHTASKLSTWVSESFSAAYAFELANDPAALAGFGVTSSIVGSPDRYPLTAATQPTPVGAVLRDRHSVAEFGASHVGFDQLSRILLDTACFSSTGSRGTPSAGALYPLDVYLCITGVQNLPSGIYALNPHTAELNRLRIRTDPRKFLSEALLFQNLAESSAFHVFFIASFARQRIKYGQRSYRFTLIEAGHLAQAMIMSAQESGIASCPVGGFIDQEVDDLLCLDGVEQSVVYSVAFGTPPSDDAA